MALQFTYNGYTAQIVNKSKLNLRDGELSFSGDFYVTADSDANFKAALDTAEDKLTENNRAFSITLGVQTLVSWDPATNSGFLQKVSLRKGGTAGDTARSRLYTFEIEAQREPQVAARAGRREAEIIVEEPAPDTMRRLRFRGTWTALVNSGTPKDAYTAFTDNVAAWISSWLAILTTTGIWQPHGKPTISFEDENKVLRFDVAYAEVKFTSTPTETTKGIYTTGQFVRQDPASAGIPTLDTRAPDWAPGQRGQTAVAGQGLGPDKIPRRYSVSTTTYLNDKGATNPNSYWESTIRKWIVATLQSMFGSTVRAIIESHSVPMEDVSGKSISCQATIMVARSDLIVKYDEKVRRRHDRRLVAENIWDGQSDHYDLIEGGRRLEIEQIVTVRTLDNPPAEPNYLGGDWQFLDEDFVQSREIIDPTTDAVVAVDYTHTRRYLYAPASVPSGAVITQDREEGKQFGRSLGAPGKLGGAGELPSAREPDNAGTGDLVGS